MKPERVDYQAVLESLADGVEVDWAALETFAATDANAAAIATCGSSPVSRSFIARSSFDDDDPRSAGRPPMGTSSRRPAHGDTSTCRSGLPEARSATCILPAIRTSIAKSRSSSSASTPRRDSRRSPARRGAHARARPASQRRHRPWRRRPRRPRRPVDGVRARPDARVLGAGARRARPRRSHDPRAWICAAPLRRCTAPGSCTETSRRRTSCAKTGDARPHGFRRGPRAGRRRRRARRARRSTSRRRCWPADPRRRGATSTASASCCFTC